ncbi:hypothetical protein [Amycolatopsis sp. RTGN1]|uniref:hypothetical protein n=1 Tax=Amycolatopsis ponsaeliensis TaxID=2992142 RepID=UPI00255062F0|nr:hypothetical protein [Amycolatopsis sp. RTGN1]
MTNPKTAESRVTAGRPKPATAPTAKTGKEAATVSTEDSTAAGPAHNGQNPVLDQLVALTRSIGDLVQQNVGTGDQLTTAATDAAEQARVVFAYDFLGVVLGRRAPSVFQLTTVTVERRFGTLTFTGLGAAKAAKIRAADNTVRFLEGLRDGVAVTIDEGPKAISDDLRIDSIITFTALGGTPVAIGPCLGPAVGGDG